MRRHSGRVKKASLYGTAPIHNLFGSASEGVLSEPRAETHSLYTFTVSELITPGGEEACHWGYRGWDGPQRVVSDGDLVWGSIHVGSASVLFSSCAHTAQTPTASAALLVRSINSAIALSITCFIGAFMKAFSVRGRISWSGRGPTTDAFLGGVFYFQCTFSIEGRLNRLYYFTDPWCNDSSYLLFSPWP